jgi:hypothetical protein
MKIAEVVWLDAKHQFGPISIAGIEPGAVATTVGYLLRCDKEFVVVAMERFPDEYRNVTSIPRALVKRVRYVERCET